VEDSERVAWSLVWDAARRCDTVDKFAEWVGKQDDIIRLVVLGEGTAETGESK
jgi:hypothetical protein